MGNAASVIPNKLHTAREAVGHTANTAREAFEHTASTAREAVRNGVHNHGRKVKMSSLAAGAVRQQPLRKGDQETPTIAESKRDNEEVPGGVGRLSSRGNDNNSGSATATAAAAAASAKATGTTPSSQKRAGSVREKHGDCLKDAPSDPGRGRGLAPDDKATSKGGSSSRAQEQRGDVGDLQQHRNSRRGEVDHSATNKTLQQQGKQDRESCRVLGERSSGEDAVSVGTTSGSSGGSYTSSSYSSSGSDDSCDDDGSDDTFFVPQVRYMTTYIYYEFVHMDMFSYIRKLLEKISATVRVCKYRHFRISKFTKKNYSTYRSSSWKSIFANMHGSC